MARWMRVEGGGGRQYLRLETAHQVTEYLYTQIIYLMCKILKFVVDKIDQFPTVMHNPRSQQI